MTKRITINRDPLSLFELILLKKQLKPIKYLRYDYYHNLSFLFRSKSYQDLSVRYTNTVSFYF